MSWQEWEKFKKMLAAGSPGPDMETADEEMREAIRRQMDSSRHEQQNMRQDMIQQYQAMQARTAEMQKRMEMMEAAVRMKEKEEARKKEAEPTISMKQAQAIMDILIDMAKEEDAAERAWLVAKAAGLLLGLAGERDRQLRQELPRMIIPDGLTGIVDDGQSLNKIYRAYKSQNVGSPSEGGNLPMPKGQW